MPKSKSTPKPAPKPVMSAEAWEAEVYSADPTGGQPSRF